MPTRDNISQAIKVLCSRWDHLRSQQEWMTDTTNFHDQCPVLDGYISEKFQNSSSMDGHKTADVPKDIIPSDVDNDIMLLKVCIASNIYIANGETMILCFLQHAGLAAPTQGYTTHTEKKKKEKKGKGERQEEKRTLCIIV